MQIWYEGWVMLRKFYVSTIVLAAVLTAAFNPPDAAARARNAAAAAAATQDTDKPAPDTAEAKAYKQKRFEDCVAIWDKGTHMTKEQWRRTCKNSLEDLPGL
jgi:Ni/Co efflux regulator RcnB